MSSATSVGGAVHSDAHNDTKVRFPVDAKLVDAARKMMKTVYEPTNDEASLFRLVALEAQRSSDPNTQVGAIAVNPDGKVIAVGHARPIKGLEGRFNWIAPDGETHEVYKKYPFLIMAEMDLIKNAQESGQSLKGSKVYMTLVPGSTNFGYLIEEGVRELIARVPDGTDWAHWTTIATQVILSQEPPATPIWVRLVKPITFDDVPTRFKALTAPQQ